MNIELIQTTLQALSTATNGIQQLMSNGTLIIGNAMSYPVNAIPVTDSSLNVANASAIATIAASASKTAYLVGIDITSSGATAAKIVGVSVTGLTGGTMGFVYGALAGATVLNAPMSVRFAAPIPASAINTAITVTMPALGAGSTNAIVNIYGYYL